MTRNLAAADALLASTRKHAESLEAALKKVEVPASTTAASLANMKAQEAGLKSLEHQAIKTAAAETAVGVAAMATQQNFANALRLRDAQAYQFGTPLRSGGAIPMGPAFTPMDTSLRAAFNDMNARNEQALASIRNASGAIPMGGAPAGTSFADAERAYREMRQAALDAQRVGGAIPMGQGGAPGIPGSLRTASGAFAMPAASGRVTSDLANAAMAEAAFRRLVGPFAGSGAGEHLTGGFFGGRSGLSGGDSDRARSGLVGMLFGARASENAASRVGSAIEREAARALSGTAGGGGSHSATGLTGGILPGGARASAAATTAGLGILAMVGPSIGPALAGIGVGASAGAGALLGGIGTIALAFHGLSEAAFTTQKGFDALNPVQQRFVTTLRSLEAGLGATLTGIAQRTVLPGVTSGLRSAFTPASMGALTGGVGAFGGALAGGAQQAGSVFGSSGFASSFGTVLKADAGYLRDMIDGTVRLTNAFVHLLEAAIPLTDWMDKGLLDLAKWAESATLAGQASGGLASFFEKSRESLKAWGELIASVGAAFGALFGAIGFTNAVGTLQLITDVFQALADLINANKMILRNFFTGALAAAHDALRVIEGVGAALTFLLKPLDRIVKAFGGWEIVLDGLLVFWAAKMVPGMIAGLVAIGTAATATLPLIVGFATALYGAYKLGQWLGQLISPAADPNSTEAKEANAARFGLKQLPSGQWVHAGLGTGGPGSPGTAPLPGTASTPFAPGMGGRPALPLTPEQKLQAKTDAFLNPFGTAKPLLGTGKSGVLPSSLELAIAQAESNAAAGGSTGPQVAALRAGIAYIDKHVAGIKDPTEAARYYQERTGLYGQIASIQSADAAAAKAVQDAKQAKIDEAKAARDEREAARIAGVQDSFHRMLGISGGVPGVAALRTSLRRTEEHVDEARDKGMSIPKATLTALDKIHGVLEKSLKAHVELDSLTRGNVVARLAQINDTLKSLVHGTPSNFRVPNEQELVRGLGLNAEQRRRVGQRLAETAELGGMVHRGPAALGIALGAHGQALHITNIGNVHVEVTGAGVHADQVAKNVMYEIQKSARRNATQTRGPNAGRNRGLN